MAQITKTRKPPNRKRTVCKSFWFTPEEWAQFEALAEKAGLSNPEYMRLQTLQKAPRVKAAEFDRQLLRQLLAALGKIGGNLNQIAKAAHLGRQLEGMLQHALIDLMEIRPALLEQLGKRPYGDDES